MKLGFLFVFVFSVTVFILSSLPQHTPLHLCSVPFQVARQLFLHVFFHMWCSRTFRTFRYLSQMLKTRELITYFWNISISFDIWFTINWWFDPYSLFLKISLILWEHYALKAWVGNWKCATYPYPLHQGTTADLTLEPCQKGEEHLEEPHCIQH